MALQAILFVGIVLLTCGSMGLLVVRLQNPRLKGLAWLVPAFVSGAIGAALLALSGHVPAFLTTLLADLFLLLAFIFLHLAICDLVSGEAGIPFLGGLLIAIQGVVDLYVLYTAGTSHLRAITFALAVSIQAGQTSYCLRSVRKRDIRPAARFGATILLSFICMNVLRVAASVLGILRNHPRLSLEIAAASFTLYLAVALGIAFSVFWMTTASLTSELEQMASVDPLTRLYNRRVFLRWCEQELARSRASGQPFSLLMLDLDYFKQINDSFGHAVGDTAICAAVERMQHAVRGVDVMGRWGGEEFTVLLPSADLQAAYLVAERVRGNICGIIINEPLGRKNRGTTGFRLTASVGVATYRGADDDIQSMLQRADHSLYEAKAAGRNQVVAMA